MAATTTTNTIPFQLSGRVINITPEQYAKAQGAKALKALANVRIEQELKRLHPGLGQSRNQLAGWIG